MELEIWPDAWTLPSIDPECIAVFYYLHPIVFGSGQDSRVINSFDPSGSANGRSLALSVHRYPFRFEDFQLTLIMKAAFRSYTANMTSGQLSRVGMPSWAI